MKKIYKIATTAIWICLIGLLLLSGYNLEKKLDEYRTAYDISTKRVMETRKGRKVDFAKLKKQNKDVKGWIWLKDTPIDYPIVQGEDNDYYLHRDLDGNYLYDGCIFIDFLVEHPFKDFNTVIYGHRMRSGSMFHDLSKYSDKEFFDKHPIIIIETEDQSYDLHVVAFCTEMSNSDLYSIDFKNSDSTNEDTEDPENAVVFDDRLTKKEFVELIRSTAKNITDEEFDENDTYVTLSTCAFASGEERNQVIGVLKKAPLEEKEVTVKTEKPPLNKWLVFQIIVGAIMAASVLIPIIRVIKSIVKKSH